MYTQQKCFSIAVYLLFAPALMFAQNYPTTIVHDLTNNQALVIPATDSDNPVTYVITGTWSEIVPTQSDNSAHLANASLTPVTVQNGFNGTVILDNVEIYRSIGSGSNARNNHIDVQDGAHVVLKLKGTSKLWAETWDELWWDAAILHVAQNAYLTIESYNGVDADGTLIVKPSIPKTTGKPNGGGAAIGGNNSNGSPQTSGHITINSGTIDAAAGNDAAAIGGGSFGGAGGYITINGGIVKATSDSRGTGPNGGAAIGTGYGHGGGASSDTYIVISGGDITATSLLSQDERESGAAIGTGNNFKRGFGYIIITGGTIKASVRCRFNDNGEPIDAFTDGDMTNTTVLGHDDMQSGMAGLWYNGSQNSGIGLGGHQAPAIGMGANCNLGTSTGLIVILPSANVSRVYGGVTWTNTNTTSGGQYTKDIGNCNKLFYLNKASLRVGLTSGSEQKQTKKFTARTADKLARQDIFVYVPEVDNFVPGVAAKVGTTSNAPGTPVVTTDDSLGVVWTNSAVKVLNYYTNMTIGAGNCPVFFTDAIPSGGAYQFFKHDFDPGAGLNPGETYNPSSTAAYNVIIPHTFTPNPGEYDFKISNPWNSTAYANPPLDQTEIELDFGSAEFNNTNILPDLNLTAISKLFRIGQTGIQWLNIRQDPSSTVSHFDLDGPIVTSPSIAGGQNLPAGSPSNITVNLKSRLPVGQHVDTLKFIAIKPDNTQVLRKALLKVNITKFNATSQSEQYARMTARRPSPPTAPSTVILTNSQTVQLSAQAIMSDIDRVETVWYAITENPLPPAVSGTGRPLPTDAGWTKKVMSGTSYSEPLGNINFPTSDQGKVYYIHWYIETQNSFGAHGTISSYEVDARKPAPVIYKDGSPVVFNMPVAVNIKFQTAGNADRKVGPEANITFSAFSIENATITNITETSDSLLYAVTLQPNGLDAVRIKMNENIVRDKYGNQNIASNLLTLPLGTGFPTPVFSGYMDSVYNVDPPAIAFRVGDGLNNTPFLYANDATTSIAAGVNAHNIFELYKSSDNPPTQIPLTAINTDYDPANGEFRVANLFTEGEYEIHIFQDSIKNNIGKGIVDTVFRFRVLAVALSQPSVTAIDFGRKNEGYRPLSPFTISLTNSGNAPVYDLSVVLESANTNDTPAAFELNVASFAATLNGASQTSFTVRPKTGLAYSLSDPLNPGTPYAATIAIKSGDVTIATCRVEFCVTRIPAPNVDIDYISEEFYHLPTDSALQVCWILNNQTMCKTVKTDADRTGISEAWMNGQNSTLAVVDTENDGATGLERQIAVPVRPAAPVLEEWDNMHDININSGIIYGVNDSMQYRKEGDDEWINLLPGQTRIMGLGQGVYFVRYRAIQNTQFASHTAVVQIGLTTPPVIMRRITLPTVAGVTFTPASGDYYVPSRNDFQFSVVFADEKVHEVITNRIFDNQQERLTGTPNGNGGYDYLIRFIQQPVTVSIGDILAAGENVGNTAVWAHKGKIHIASAADGEAQIYTASGAMVEQVRLTGGATASIPAARGAYIILTGYGKAYKVMVN